MTSYSRGPPPLPTLSACHVRFPVRRPFDTDTPTKEKPMTTETEIVAQSLENFITEKQSLAQRELELLTQLKAALNRLGYDLLPLDPEATPPLATRPADPSTQPQRRRGRPRKKPLES